MKFWNNEVKNNVFDFDTNKKLLIDNLDLLKGMSVQEQTLYKKWREWNDDLQKSMKKLPLIQSYIDLLWKPTDIFNKDLTISEISLLEPYVKIAEDSTKWNNIRRLISSMEYSQNPGRNIKGYVMDRVSGKILGLINLGSDITSLGVRDKHIGWNKDNKFKDGKLNHTCIGTTIIPTQPLGYNFLGGKLMSVLTTSEVFRSEWFDRYGDVLVAVGTTSLYGNGSQYNGIPQFKSLGESNGLINIKPDTWIYKIWKEYIKEKYPEKYRESQKQSGPKQKMIGLIFDECGIKKDTYHHGFKRGVYFSPIYQNTNDFLCSKIELKDLIIKDRFKDDNIVIEWWRNKSLNRYTTLFNDNKIKPETLFYSDIIGMSWEDCKQKYLSEVGR